ncbi:MAG TPA: ATP-binding protein [Bryobacteraceae bacterium]|nr:ATP-binding protein [Bryobacteraceae bacterium]
MHTRPDKRIAQLLSSILAVAVVTGVAARVAHVNATTVGFAYLLVVLVIASTWGFLEAAAASVAATLGFNYFFLPPVGTFTIADPQNWIALFSFLATALIVSRLSTVARQRARDAVERQQDIERLYSFSRAILLADAGQAVPRQIVNSLAEVFRLSAATLYERRTGESWHGGPADFDGLQSQLREAALLGTSFFDPEHRRVITAVRLGADPIASLGLEGPVLPDSVLQGIANLVAIGLERARAQEVANEAEAARQSEKLRTALIDAVAHEFKTPLTSIKAATTALLAAPESPAGSRNELLKIADQEADRLRVLMDDAIEMSRLDTGKVRVEPEAADVCAVVRGVLAAMATGIDDRPIEVSCPALPPARIDRRLFGLAVRQLLDNAFRYSPAGTPVRVSVVREAGTIAVAITDQGAGIPAEEQARIFDRFYRGRAAQSIHGSGLGLSIAKRVAQAHGGDVVVASRPGETTFTLRIPLPAEGAAA